MNFLCFEGEVIGSSQFRASLTALTKEGTRVYLKPIPGSSDSDSLSEGGTDGWACLMSLPKESPEAPVGVHEAW